MIFVTGTEICMAILYILNYMFRLSVTKKVWFCKCATLWMFPHLYMLLEYCIEHITLGLLYVMFTFPSRVFYGGVPGFQLIVPVKFGVVD